MTTANGRKHIDEACCLPDIDEGKKMHVSYRSFAAMYVRARVSLAEEYCGVATEKKKKKKKRGRPCKHHEMTISRDY